MPFQRTNLHLSVSFKNGTAAAANLAWLVADARAAEGRGVRLEATLIYAQTTREVDELAAHLQQQGVLAVK
jgi:superfamily II DNA helicase RecQ